MARGLGRALAAEAALRRGDTVIGTTRDGAADLVREEGTLHLIALDVADSGNAERAITRAFELCGRIDVMVNNAGYGLLRAIEEATDAEVERLFAVNLFGPFRLIRAALPRLHVEA